MRISHFTILMFFCLASEIAGQTRNYFGLFPTIDHSGTITDRLGYNVYLFDAIKPYQTSENGFVDKSRSLFAYAEAGISARIGKNVTFSNAYVYERQQPFRPDFRNEHRLFQQLTFSKNVRRTGFKQRIRFDERFIENRSTGKLEFSHRLRLLLGIRYPLKNDIGYFSCYTEFFLNTMPGSLIVFNENWSSANVGFRLNDNNDLEVGLLYVGWVVNNDPDWLNQHFLQLTWVNRLDFRKSARELQ